MAWAAFECRQARPGAHGRLPRRDRCQRTHAFLWQGRACGRRRQRGRRPSYRCRIVSGPPGSGLYDPDRRRDLLGRRSHGKQGLQGLVEDAEGGRRMDAAPGIERRASGAASQAEKISGRLSRRWPEAWLSFFRTPSAAWVPTFRRALRSSLLATELLQAGLDQFFSFAGPYGFVWLEFAAAKLVVAHEKFDDLLDEVRTEIAEALRFLIGLGVGGDADQPVVSRPALVLLFLLRLDRADQADRDDAAGDHRCFHQNQNIEWVAVVAERRRDEAEIIGKHHALRQHGRELQAIAFGIVAVFVATALRGLDDDAEVLGLGVVRCDGRKDGMACSLWRHMTQNRLRNAAALQQSTTRPYVSQF